MIDIKLKASASDLSTLKRKLTTVPARVFTELGHTWSVDGEDFINLMKNKHLGGPTTTATRLKRVSSNLYNSLHKDVKVSNRQLTVKIYFLSSVTEYALVHEYGSSKRNIPPRMNLRNEWKKYRPKLLKNGNAAVRRALKNG